MAFAIALLSGLLFGAGLVVSQMNDPSHVRAFLTIGSEWDPSLLLVLGAAIAIHATILAWASRTRPMESPGEARKVDWRLICGAALFGVGWGLVGYCPGPALVSLAAGRLDALWLVVGMSLGVLLFDGRGSAERSEAPSSVR